MEVGERSGGAAEAEEAGGSRGVAGGRAIISAENIVISKSMVDGMTCPLCPLVQPPGSPPDSPPGFPP